MARSKIAQNDIFGFYAGNTADGLACNMPSTVASSAVILWNWGGFDETLREKFSSPGLRFLG